MSSIFLLPYSLYFSLAYWIYPLKDYIGDTGCYVAIYGRDIGNYITQTHSFFVAMFRYNCLFNGTILKKINLSPNVSSCFKPQVKQKQLSCKVFILLFFDRKISFLNSVMHYYTALKLHQSVLRFFRRCTH
jgi:hypothetical protein